MEYRIGLIHGDGIGPEIVNEAKKILKQIKEEKSRNVTSNGDVEVTNNGNNSGVISGINSGEIRS